MIEQAIANLTESINKQTIVLEKIAELVGIEMDDLLTEQELDFGQEEDVFEEAKKQTNALDMFKIACNVLNGPKKLQNVLSVRTKKILTDLGINHITLSALDAKTVQAFRGPFFAACEELYAQGI